MITVLWEGSPLQAFRENFVFHLLTTGVSGSKSGPLSFQPFIAHYGSECSKEWDVLSGHLKLETAASRTGRGCVLSLLSGFSASTCVWDVLQKDFSFLNCFNPHEFVGCERAT